MRASCDSDTTADLLMFGDGSKKKNVQDFSSDVTYKVRINPYVIVWQAAGSSFILETA